MKKTDVIPYEDYEKIYDERKALSVREKKKRKTHFFKRFFSLILIVGLCGIIYYNFDKIQAFTSILFESSQGQSNNPPLTSDSDLNTDSSLSSDTENDNIQNDNVIPPDSFKIIENNSCFTEITNEAGIEFDLSNIVSDVPNIEEIYKKFGNEAPIVLIIHSSVLESYSNGEYYSTSDCFYSNKDNVGDVGKIICETLNEHNINAIHIDDIYANGSIYSSTNEYKKMLSDTLEKYPSIAFVFDISRNVLINEDLSMNKNVVNYNEEKIAQIKLTIGTSNNEKTTFWHKNLLFAHSFSSKNNDLIYDLTLSKFELSQNIEPIAVRADIGSFANSKNEALLAGRELAIRLSEFLSQG